MTSIFECSDVLKGSKRDMAVNPKRTVSPVNKDEFRAAGLPVRKANNHVVHAPNADKS